MTDTIASVDFAAVAQLGARTVMANRQHSSTHFPNIPNPVNQGITPSRRPTQRFKVTCTHISMDRLHGPFSCDLCHEPSPLGWLYRCCQDAVVMSYVSPCDCPMDDADLSSDNSAELQQELLGFGFSKSIISQALAGEYTPAQLQVLKEQKKHLRKMLAAEPQCTAGNHKKKSSLLPAVWGNSSITSRTPPMWSRSPVPDPACRFKCCQHCRSCMSDRCFTTFDAVFADEVPPFRAEEMGFLPMKLPSIACTLGLTSTPTLDDSKTVHLRQMLDSGPKTPEEVNPTTAPKDSSASSDTTVKAAGSGPDSTIVLVHKVASDPAHLKSGFNEVTTPALSVRPAIRHASREPATPDLGVRPSIRHVSREAEADCDTPDHSFSTASRSGSSVSLPTSSTARTSPVHNQSTPCYEGHDDEFDDEYAEFLRDLAKSRAERRLDKANSFEDLVQGGPVISGPDDSLCRPLDKKSRSSSLETFSSTSDNAMEIDGGVELTEKAVQTNTPDLVAIHPSMSRTAVAHM